MSPDALIFSTILLIWTSSRVQTFSWRLISLGIGPPGQQVHHQCDWLCTSTSPIQRWELVVKWAFNRVGTVESSEKVEVSPTPGASRNAGNEKKGLSNQNDNWLFKRLMLLFGLESWFRQKKRVNNPCRVTHVRYNLDCKSLINWQQDAKILPVPRDCRFIPGERWRVGDPFLSNRVLLAETHVFLALSNLIVSDIFIWSRSDVDPAADNIAVPHSVSLFIKAGEAKNGCRARNVYINYNPLFNRKHLNNMMGIRSTLRQLIWTERITYLPVSSKLFTTIGLPNLCDEVSARLSFGYIICCPRQGLTSWIFLPST